MSTREAFIQFVIILWLIPALAVPVSLVGKQKT